MAPGPASGLRVCAPTRAQAPKPPGPFFAAPLAAPLPQQQDDSTSLATITRDLTAGLVTTKNDDVTEVNFTAGTAVEVIQEWAEFWLVKDADGHFYNLPKDAVSP